MNQVLNSILNEINTFEPQKYENMSVIGLNIPENNKLDLMSLEIGLNMGLVDITEVNEGGSVGEVKVVNKAVTPLLLLDGEEIIGSKQNRIVNTTIIIPANSEKIIPVSCTEQGRWNYNSTKFNYSHHMATSNVRRDKLYSVSQSLKNSKSFHSNQSKVWENIAETEKNLKISSLTNALDDSYAQKSNDIDDYKKAFTLHEKQNGIIVYINGEIVGFELIYNSQRYSEYHEKLVESYILDAITKQDLEYNEDKYDEIDFIKTIKESEFESYDSVGLGKDCRVDNDEVTGSAMIYNDKLINASFFKKIKI